MSKDRIFVKRAYDELSDNDGWLVLVDRIWPRGVSKKDLQIDDWIKDIAPSSELRKWFSHDPEKWDKFKSRYFAELDDKREITEKLKSKLKEKGKLTLVYSAKDTEHNNAKALKEYLQSKL